MKFLICRNIDVDNDEDNIVHYGIKGQKWGVRRFENPDGTLTDLGKERYGSNNGHDGKTKNGEFIKDSELNELTADGYRAERKKIALNHPDGLTDEEIKIVDRIAKGEIVDRNEIDKIGSDHFYKGLELGKKYQSSTSESERKEISKQIDQESRISEYAYNELFALSSENKYDKETVNETDTRYIDPTYRKFSSKTEKANAEADYLKNLWYSDAESMEGEERKKWERNIQHLTSRVNNLSYDGYFQSPRSDRIRSMFDYHINDDDYSEHWSRWTPKSDEWKKIQSDREMLKDKTGYTKAMKDYKDATVSGAFRDGNNKPLYEKLSKALSNAQRKYDARVKASNIEKREKAFEKTFNEKIAKAVLQDLGYEINDTNVKYISDIIWWD